MRNNFQLIFLNEDSQKVVSFMNIVFVDIYNQSYEASSHKMSISKMLAEENLKIQKVEMRSFETSILTKTRSFETT